MDTIKTGNAAASCNSRNSMYNLGRKILSIALCVSLLMVLLGGCSRSGRRTSHTQQPQQKPVKTSQEALTNAAALEYIALLEAALNENRAAYSGGDSLCNAVLVDLDGDGAMELAVTHLVAEDVPLSPCDVVLSIYDYENGRIFTRVDREAYGRFGAAGQNASIEILHKDGNPVIMTYYETGETSRSGAFLPARKGTAVVYDGKTFLTDCRYSLERNTNYLYFSVNDRSVSERDFLKELGRYKGVKGCWNERMFLLEFSQSTVSVTQLLEELYRKTGKDSPVNNTEDAPVVTQPKPDPVYINTMDFSDKYGKLWLHENRHYSSGNSVFNDYSATGHLQRTVMDNDGNTYRYGLHVDGAGANTYYVTYDLGGDYTSFSGTCILPYEQRYTASTKYFLIYCDGVRVFTSNTMQKGCKSQSFEIDVTGTQYLTIQYPPTDGSNETAVLCDGLLK